MIDRLLSCTRNCFLNKSIGLNGTFQKTVDATTGKLDAGQAMSIAIT